MGLMTFFTDSIFGEAAQLLKEGVKCALAYGQHQLCGHLFSAAVSCSHTISYVLAYYFPCDFLFQRLVQPGEEFGRFVASLLVGQELFGRFSSRWKLYLPRSKERMI